MFQLNTNSRYLHENFSSFAEALTATMPEPLNIMCVMLVLFCPSESSIRYSMTHVPPSWCSNSICDFQVLHCRYATCSGSESNDLALRVARTNNPNGVHVVWHDTCRYLS